MASFHYDDESSLYDDGSRIYDLDPVVEGGGTANVTFGGSANALVVSVNAGSGQLQFSGETENLVVVLSSGLGEFTVEGLSGQTDVIKLAETDPGVLTIEGEATSLVVVMSAGVGQSVFDGETENLAIVIGPGTGEMTIDGAGYGYRLGEIISAQWPSEARRDTRTRLDWVIPADENKKLRVVAPPGTIVRFIAPQLEESPYVRPFVRTTGSEVTRSASRMELESLNRFFSGRRGAIFFRYRVRLESRYKNTGESVLWAWLVDENNLFEIKYDYFDQRFEFRRLVDSVESISVVDKELYRGDDLIVGGIWTSSGIQLVVNDDYGDEDAGDGYDEAITVTSDVGSDGSSNHIDSDVMKMVAVRGSVAPPDARKIRSLIRTPLVDPSRYPSDCVLVADFTKRTILG